MHCNLTRFSIEENVVQRIMIIKGLIHFIEAGAYKYGFDARKEVHKRGNQKFSLNRRSLYTYAYAVGVTLYFLIQRSHKYITQNSIQFHNK